MQIQKERESAGLESIENDVIGGIFSDLRETFTNVHQSLILLYERGDILENLERKSKDLLARSHQIEMERPTRCYRFSLCWGWCFLQVCAFWRWLMSTSSCRVIRGDPSMHITLVDL